MNKKIIGIASSAVAATTLVLFFALSGLATPANQPQKLVGLYPPDVELFSVIPSIPVSSEQEASVATGQTIKFPTYLPSGYAIRVTNVDSKIHSAIILAAAQPITAQTTREQFLSEKGIDIYMEPVTSAFDENNWKALWIQQNSGNEITVNGLDGVMHDMKKAQPDSGTIDAPSEMVIFKHGMMISLTAVLPVGELIKVANTL